jgi:hypothetical protein
MIWLFASRQIKFDVGSLHSIPFVFNFLFGQDYDGYIIHCVLTLDFLGFSIDGVCLFSFEISDDVGYLLRSKEYINTQRSKPRFIDDHLFCRPVVQHM